MIPRLKPISHFARGCELVFQLDLGVELRIEDPDGQILQLVRLLDGTRSIEDVHDHMKHQWPDLTLDHLREGIDGLGEAGLLDDAAATSTLSARQTDRYASNQIFLSSFATLGQTGADMQARLLRSHVLLLGVGGAGSNLLMALAGLGVGRVTVVDYDTIELKNLTRQFLYMEADIGTSKLQRAVAWAHAFNADMRIASVERKIGSVDDVFSLLEGVDLVLSAIDEPPIQVDAWVNEACVRASVPFIMGGTRLRRALYLSVQPGISGCLECLQLVSPSPAGDSNEAVPDGRPGASTGPAMMLVGGLMGLETLRYLTGFAPPVAAGKVWLIDLAGGHMDVGYPWERQPNCPVCGDDRR